MALQQRRRRLTLMHGGAALGRVCNAPHIRPRPTPRPLELLDRSAVARFRGDRLRVGGELCPFIRRSGGRSDTGAGVLCAMSCTRHRQWRWLLTWLRLPMHHIPCYIGLNNLTRVEPLLQMRALLGGRHRSPILLNLRGFGNVGLLRAVGPCGLAVPHRQRGVLKRVRGFLVGALRPHRRSRRILLRRSGAILARACGGGTHLALSAGRPRSERQHLPIFPLRGRALLGPIGALLELHPRLAEAAARHGTDLGALQKIARRRIGATQRCSGT